MTKAAGKSRLKEQAIAALLSSRTIKDAAKQSGVAERSVLRWLKEPEFQAQYESAKRELLNGAINRLRMGGYDAAIRLHQVVVDRNASPAAAVSASWRLFDLMLKADVIESLSKRLDRLEGALKDGDQ